VDFDLTQEQQLFLDTTRRFLEAESHAGVVRKLAYDPAGFDRGWWRRAAGLGWLSLLVAEDHGGAGLGDEGAVYLGIVAEELGRFVAPGPVLVSAIVAATLSRSGSAAQRSDVLPALLDGDAVATWCIAERGGSWDAAEVALEARRDGGGFTLTGVKGPVEAGARADLLLVTARCEGELTQFLVPAAAPGITTTPLDGLDLVRRFAEISFDGVTVPAGAAVGPVGGAAGDVERQTQLALALSAAESAGAADQVLAFTLQWAFDRFSFGRPLASYQALKHRFADMKMWLEACHATASAALRAIADEAPDAGRLARVAKSYTGDHAPEIVQDCVQMHGGIGVTWDHDIHLYLRRVATNRVAYGEPAAHRERIAALLEI
jgi:alkylation response protein AidB-like acyl-CoA dehydrogenase